jgi:hypothetical protein
MNKFIISFLHGITLCGLILFTASFLLNIGQVVFDVPTSYKLNKKGTSSFESKNYIMPVRIQMTILTDTLVNYQGKPNSNFTNAGSFHPNAGSIFENNNGLSELKERVLEHKNEIDIDTIVGYFRVFPADNHPYFKNRDNGKFLKNDEARIYSLDAIDKEPVFKANLLNYNTQALVEIKTTTLRDKFLFVIPQWIEKIIIWILIFQLYSILNNFKQNIIFEAKSISKIQIVGFMVIGLFFVPFLTNYIYNFYLISSISYDTKHLSFLPNNLSYQGIKLFITPNKEIVFTHLYVGLITLILATIFKRGLALQQEQDLTV